jgi:hypothetical protein
VQPTSENDNPGVSNGPTECLNLKVKNTKRAARGYRSLANYTLRLLLNHGLIRDDQVTNADPNQTTQLGCVGPVKEPHSHAPSSRLLDPRQMRIVERRCGRCPPRSARRGTPPAAGNSSAATSRSIPTTRTATRRAVDQLHLHVGADIDGITVWTRTSNDLDHSPNYPALPLLSD